MFYVSQTEQACKKAVGVRFFELHCDEFKYVVLHPGRQ